jgi:putative peptidoglycan lipid II flippase
VLLVAVVLVAVTNLLAAIAQAHRRFFWSAAEGVPFNLVMIAAAAGFGPRYGVTALAVGFVAGSALRLACQLPALRGLGLRIRPALRWDDPGARQIAHVLPPLLLGSAVTNVNTLVDRAVGSLVGEGVISSLSYGWRLTSLADTLVTVSLVTVAYPAFGAAAARPAELARLLDRSLRTVVTVLLPVVAVLMVASQPVVALVYERGSFSSRDTSTTATAVLFYAPAVLFIAWRELVVRASYALADTRRPVAVAVLAMVLNVIGDLTLGRHFGIAGLAASTTLAVLVAAAANSWWLARHHGIGGIAAVAGSLWRVGGAGAGCAGALAVAVAVAPDPGTSTVGRLGLVIAVALIAGISYWIGLVLLRAPERALVGYTLALVAGRFTRAGR